MRSFFSAILLTLIAAVAFTACNEGDTYADQKARERSAINKFITNEGINVISEKTFKEQGNVTYLDQNQFVLFENTGVYMQIVRQGCGEKIKSGETARVLCRYLEVNLMTDSAQSTNNILYWSSIVDKMDVTNVSGTFTASLVSGESVFARDAAPMMLRFTKGDFERGFFLNYVVIYLRYLDIISPDKSDDYAV